MDSIWHVRLYRSSCAVFLAISSCQSPRNRFVTAIILKHFRPSLSLMRADNVSSCCFYIWLYVPRRPSDSRHCLFQLADQKKRGQIEEGKSPWAFSSVRTCFPNMTKHTHRKINVIIGGGSFSTWHISQLDELDQSLIAHRLIYN